MIPLIWNAIGGYAAWAVAGLVALLAALIAGKRVARQAAVLRSERKARKDMEVAIDIRDATNAKNDAAVRASLDEWVRPE